MWKHVGMAEVDLAVFLAEHPPFDSLGPDALGAIARAAQMQQFGDGDLILDAFTTRTDEVFVVIDGRVHLRWTDDDKAHEEPAMVLGPGGVFGFSAMLTKRLIGPRAVAAAPTTVARIPGSVAEPAFTSRRGARFIAENMSAAHPGGPGMPTYSLIDELIERRPLVVGANTPVGDVARRMTEKDRPVAVVPIGPGQFGLVTDALLRARVLVDGRPPSTPVHEIMDTTAPVAVLGESAAEALMRMLDQNAEFLLVTDRAGGLCGVVNPRDFAISPSAVGASLHEQLRRATSIDDLASSARRVPPMLSDLLTRGLASGKVIAVYSAFLDTIIRQAIGLVFAQHPELSVDAFTWLSLGSNGRREAVLSSDVDSAVAFDNAVSAEEIVAYRAAFGEISGVLATAGLSADNHGATAQQALFARTNADWRAAARQWLADPVEHNGAMMTSLLVDGRPIHGDPGLPAATRVFSDLREHSGTMRLLLRESLARRAKLKSAWGIFARRPDTFDIKAYALLPVVNIGSWAALSVGSALLPTTERLRAAAGSAMLPAEAASTLIEVFEALQRLRLRYQLAQYRAGEPPTDIVTLDRLSPIDRSVVAQAVREIAGVQRRMDNVSHFVAVEDWASPEPV